MVQTAKLSLLSQFLYCSFLLAEGLADGTCKAGTSTLQEISQTEAV